MKVFMAGLDTETNTFSPTPTGYQSFAEGFLARGDATRRPLNYCSSQLMTWRQQAEACGWEVVEGLCACAEPGGRIVEAAYTRLRDELLSDLRRAMPVDIVLLALHGAMAAENIDDCEGDILAHVREIVGNAVVVGCELDLHCHLTDAMLHHATVLVTYKENPHTDIDDRAGELFTLVAAAAERRICPVMATFDCRMLGTFRTTEQPLRGFIDRLRAMEGEGDILSISLVHGFPWADVAEVGVKVLVVVDKDANRAAAIARRLGEEIFSLRESLLAKFLTIDDALDDAIAFGHGQVVIADVADNPGGGAPSDATFFLKRILQRGMRDVASGYYFDPHAVRICEEAGIGATFELRIGGKLGKTSGDPVDLVVTVRGIAQNVTQRFGSAIVSMGTAAWVRAEGVDLLLNTKRVQVFHPEGFEQVGLMLNEHKIIVVKSTQHFYAGFAPVADRILYASGPGALGRSDPLLYTKLTRPMWPLVAEPFGR
jgi:microcystin degradation protein MlrC